jgi:hypothetical protein
VRVSRYHSRISEPTNHWNAQAETSLIPQEPKVNLVVAVRALCCDGIRRFVNMQIC